MLKKGVVSRLVFIVGMLALLGGAATAGAVASNVLLNPASAAPVLYNEQAVVNLYEAASPAVVEIRSGSGISRFGRLQGQGSGFVVDNEGHILTNNHVVQGAGSVRVILWNGETLDAEVTGASPADDLALLKVDPQKLASVTPLVLGDSSKVKPGQMAIALGSPYGLQNSITVGVVSGVGRSQTSDTGRPIAGMIQTDALINPGNSGGPLLNSQGEVIGINTSVEASGSGATGIGFAVPSNTARNVLARMQTATVKRPWLGIRSVALTPTLAKELGLTVSRGAYIIEVIADSPAQRAGLIGSGVDENGVPQPGGDLITAVDGQVVRSAVDMVAYFNDLRPGDAVELTIVRGGQTLRVSAVLGEWPDNLP